MNRRDLFKFSTGGIVGAAVGYLAAKKLLNPQAPTYAYDLRIRGGYAWLFQNTAQPSIRLMCLKAASCSDATQFMDHQMLLCMQKSKVTVDMTSGNYLPTDGTSGRIYWKLDGPTTFTKGMAANGVVKAPASNPSSVADPFGPLDPLDDDLWNDLVWVAGPEKPKTNAVSFASRYLDLTEGTLTAHRPENEQARAGRWVLTDAQGNQQKRSLTDRLKLEWGSNDGISIQTAAGPIVFTPKTNKLVMHLQHELDPAHVPLNQGDRLPHFRMLYDFVDAQSCESAIAPTYDKRTDLPGTPSPGDLCPPVWLE